MFPPDTPIGIRDVYEKIKSKIIKISNDTTMYFINSSRKRCDLFHFFFSIQKGTDCFSTLKAKPLKDIP